MTRSVPEWIGKTGDTPVPPRVRLRVLERDDYRCQCGCNHRILVGEKWETDHTVSIINGGENRESNLRTLLSDHHKAKTKEDVAEKAKVYRIKAKHNGIKPKSRGWGYGKNDPLKKKIGGQVVER